MLPARRKVEKLDFIIGGGLFEGRRNSRPYKKKGGEQLLQLQSKIAATGESFIQGQSEICKKVRV